MLAFLRSVAIMLLMSSASTAAEPILNPLQFFVGRTVSEGTVQVVLKKSFRSRTVSHGTLEPDGSLTLVQQVLDEGKPPKERRWRISEVAPGKFSATMSEAVGKVSIDRVADRYRLRLKMKGGLDVEQWLTPLPNGQAARTSLTARKLGITVATSKGMISKVP
jgi:hypothetical protein